MKALLTCVIAVAMLGAIGLMSSATGQSPPAAPGASKTIEGTVLTVDPMGKILTLADGTKLTIPESVKFSRADLKPGAAVKAAYEERNGEKIVTNLEVAR